MRVWLCLIELRLVLWLGSNRLREFHATLGHHFVRLVLALTNLSFKTRNVLHWALISLYPGVSDLCTSIQHPWLSDFTANTVQSWERGQVRLCRKTIRDTCHWLCSVPQTRLTRLKGISVRLGHDEWRKLQCRWGLYKTYEGRSLSEVMAEVTKAVLKMFVEYFNPLC